MAVSEVPPDQLAAPLPHARTHARTPACTHVCTHASSARSLARSFAHPYIRDQRARYVRIGLAYGLVRTHASASRRPRARVGNARFVARVPTTARPSRSLTSLSVAPALSPAPARLSRYARSRRGPVPRRSGRRPEGSSLRRAERRHGLSSHRRHAASHPFSLPPCPPFACLPTTARRLGAFSLLFLHFTAYSCGRFVAHDVPPSPPPPPTFRARCETGRLKADARAEPNDPYRVPRRAVPCRAMRRSGSSPFS